MKKMTAAVLSLAMMLSICLVGCNRETTTPNAASADPAAKTVYIGSLHPLSGSMGSEGQIMVNAQKLAAEMINEKGGIDVNGQKYNIEIMTGDVQADATVAATEAQRLIESGCVALTGCYSSALVMTASQEAEKACVPFVVSVGGLIDLTKRGYEYFYRPQPTNYGYAQDLVQFLSEIKKDDWKTAVLCNEDSATGMSVLGYVEENLEAIAGIKVVGRVTYSPDATTLSAEAVQLQATNADLLITCGYYTDQCLLREELLSRGIEFKETFGVANGAFSSDEFIEAFGEDANGVFDDNYYYNANSDLAKEVAERYKAEYKGDLVTHAVYAYTAVQLIADAIERAQSIDPKDINAALKKTDFADHILPQKNNIIFDETGENINCASVLTQIQNGERFVVYPNEFANAELLYNE